MLGPGVTTNPSATPAMPSSAAVLTMSASGAPDVPGPVPISQSPVPNCRPLYRRAIAAGPAPRSCAGSETPCLSVFGRGPQVDRQQGARDQGPGADARAADSGDRARPGSPDPAGRPEPIA